MINDIEKLARKTYYLGLIDDTINRNKTFPQLSIQDSPGSDSIKSIFF